MKDLFKPFLSFSRYSLPGKITTDHYWHMKQFMEHDLCERTNKLIEKLLFFPRKMLVGIGMNIKVTCTHLILCCTWSGLMARCPFSHYQ